MILVTGATGAIGGEVLRLLLEAGQPVRAMVRNPAKAAALAGKVEITPGDLDVPESLHSASRARRRRS